MVLSSMDPIFFESNSSSDERGAVSFTNDLNLQLDIGITNTHSIGAVLYTEYIHLFQISGMILLVSMIGAIVLTYRKREGLKRQSYFNQISREKNSGVELVEVERDKGIKIDV